MVAECPGCKSRYDVSGRPAGTQARCRCGTSFALPPPSGAAGLLHCPGCGAAVAPGASRCEFCAAALLVKACPRCFARVFHGARHCASCGAGVVAPARVADDGEASRRRCPRCDQGLDANLVGDVLLDECPGCHGVWLDGAALERVLAERRGTTAEAVLGRLTAAPTAAMPAAGTPAGPAASTYVKCPDCGDVMSRMNFARRSGVIVDVCTSHGTWFDADELPRVIDFARRGGIEETRRKEAEEYFRQTRRARVAADGPGNRSSASTSGADGADLLGAILSVLVDG
jgi:Zn-finger nucleic acid-binding protein